MSPAGFQGPTGPPGPTNYILIKGKRGNPGHPSTVGFTGPRGQNDTLLPRGSIVTTLEAQIDQKVESLSLALL